jgi:hypothetical protein
MTRVDTATGTTRHLPRDHCLAPERVDSPIGPGGRYGRMFRVPPLEPDERLLHALGAAIAEAADPQSYLAVEPDWSPTLPARGDRFRLADLLVP